MRIRQITIGILCWLAAVAGTWISLSRELGSADHSVAALTAEISDWVLSQRVTLEAECDTRIALAVGAPVLLEETDGTYRQVGVVRGNFNRERRNHFTQRARVQVYGSALKSFPEGVELRYCTTPTSLDWVAATLLPPERRQQISAVITAEWKQHRSEIQQKLTPIVQESIQRTISVIESELPLIMLNYRNEFTNLGERYQAEIIREQIVPMVKARILPIIEEEAQPLISAIGRQLWNRVSLWSFTWRYFYDVSPLPQRDAVVQEFERFLQQEVMPELRSRTPEFVEVTERILSRISADPDVSSTIRQSLRQISADPELHRIVWGIVRDLVVQNETLRKSLEEYWNDESTQEALGLTSARIEPAARTIGDLIIGTREQGITPEFSRVLRSQVLLKDRHWLVLGPLSGGPGTAGAGNGEGGQSARVRIVRSTAPMTYPISPAGGQESPLSSLK